MIGLILEFVFHPPFLLHLEEAETAVFYFTLYSFLGWLLENSYNFITEKEFFKANFFRGPFKPMYGFAPVLLIYLIPQNAHWVKVAILCFFIPTFVEYISGLLLLKFFHRKWWDYSSHAIHLHGHICLSFSICWIILSLFCLKFLHPSIVSVYEAVSSYWAMIWPAVLFYFLAEMLLAYRRHTSQDLPSSEQTKPIN